MPKLQLYLSCTPTHWQNIRIEARKRKMSLHTFLRMTLKKEFSRENICQPCLNVSVTKHVDVTLTEEEIDRIKCHAKTQGLCVSDLIVQTLKF